MPGAVYWVLRMSIKCACTELIANIDVVIVLLLPPRSVIGSLNEAKIWTMVSILPFSVNKITLREGSMGKPRLREFPTVIRAFEGQLLKRVCHLSCAAKQVI